MMSFWSLEKRIAGLLTPLFALRAASPAQDHGCGDTAALKTFIYWAAEHGMRCVQLLPVNETGSDHSPYNAISSVAIEPTTIALGEVPDLSATDLAMLPAPPTGLSVDWPTVKRRHRTALRLAQERFEQNGDTSRQESFRRFCTEEAAWLDSYAIFRVLMDRHSSEQWDAWPEVFQSIESSRAWLAQQSKAEQIVFEREAQWHCYVQWLAYTQWRDVKNHAEACGIALMGDVPFGVNFYSADVWAQPTLFDHAWCGGAPPEPAFDGDEFVRKWGQNWGIPLYRWPQHRATDFAWWRQRVRKIAESFHLFRIDHVLGFYRIYGFPWRPQRNLEFTPLTREEAAARCSGALPHYIEHDDDTPEHKAANRAQGEEFLRVLQRESAALVGEDLGTVPDYVRPSLITLGIPGFKVPQWEHEPDTSLTPGHAYPRCSIATFATHDHEPLRALWQRWMRVIEAALHEPERLAQERDRTWWEVRRLATWAGFEVPHILPFEDVHLPLLRGLFRSESWLAIVMITDLLGTDQRFNIPGSVGDMNWSARLPADWQKQYASHCQRIATLVQESGR